MNLEELQEFAKIELFRLKEHYSSISDNDKFALAQTVKLNEEVGELCAEVLNQCKFQRKTKLDKYSIEDLESEFADVLLCTIILAKIMNVDIEKSLKHKIDKIKTRRYDE
ncbi:MAG: MazG nucleotide pyrophosphohydrolase domain-containing protein [Candidatus Woesearchaeota archaeon]|jgi:NTP pyrophosphatase (non-canonical NTP hydrolase)